MRLDELRSLVRGGESDTVEFKRSTGQRTAAAKTVCAMLNGLGGFVLFGVNDKGELVGQQVSSKTLEEVELAFARIEPPAFPEVETIHLGDDKAVIVVSVAGGRGGPYTCDGRPYIRRGPTTVRMPRDEYNRRLLERLHATQRWENQPVPDGVTIDDLDAEEIQITLDNAIRLGRLEPTTLLDHVPIAGRVISGRMVREDQPWYPPRATREAIANAICHRDYAIPGGAVAVAMYDDHLEITNPGAFHFGITPEKLTQPHESRPWNPIIANVFYRAGIIERWGSGTLNIIDWCKENGNPPPTWEERAGSVYVIFLPAVLPDVAQVTGNLGPKSVPSLSQVCPKSVPSDIFIPLLEIASNPVSIEVLMKVAGQTNRTRFRQTILRPLLDAGLIEMTIPDKPRSSKQRYRLTDAGKGILQALTDRRVTDG